MSSWLPTARKPGPSELERTREVLIYTSPFLSDDQYMAMLENARKVADKWGAYILDLTTDEAFNAEGRAHFDLYMAPDGIHPTRAGYKLWWLPRFEERITEILK